ncbi:MAG: pyridoxal-phosphate dependent enzyme [Deltaproteobacteria bacterium]|nr:pyridoxal-phosphate dependent enzyme [Deltaproteobacteria bacterium]
MNHATRVYESIVEMLSTVDNPTPLVRLSRILPFEHARVFAKLEWYNPFGAVKDRVAAHLLKDAETRGQLSPGTRLVEPTSGNTGVGLAMLANAKGYAFTATMSNKVPEEKRAALRLFGTDLRELEDDLCPAPGAPEGAIALAAKLGEEPGSFHLNQYKNPANPEAHYLTTGPEVWRQTDGSVTHFFASLGTCGTVTGTGRFLKQHKPSVKVFGVHPMEGHDVPGVRSIRQLQQTALFAPSEYDGLIEVNNADAYEWTRRLNQEESIVAGPSSGLTLAGALRHIPDEPGVVAVVLFADNVYKYMSSVQKHIPELFKGAKPAESGGLPKSLAKVLEFARGSADIVEPADAVELLPRSTLYDVRNPEEYAAGTVSGAENIPLGTLADGVAVPLLPDDKDAPIVTLCKVGERSLHALVLLKALGYRNVKSVRGGMNAWSSAGLPVHVPE